MFYEIKRMCHACPGSALANPTYGKSSKLVYNFPIEALFLVMFFDAYSAGKHSSFEGLDCYLIGCCGMCSFACMVPITRSSATTFASAIMRILLCYGICHMSVLDKYSKLFRVSRVANTFRPLSFTCLPLIKPTPNILPRDNTQPSIRL